MKPITMTIAITLTALAIATGCQEQEPVSSTPEPCRKDCSLTITLPDDPEQPPQESNEKLHLAAGGRLDVLLEGGSTGNRTTHLKFYRPEEHEEHKEAGTPFMNQNGQPVYQVNLNPGSNRLQLRPWDDGVCHQPNGCKYDIVNSGNQKRQPRDPWIILYQ